MRQNYGKLWLIVDQWDLDSDGITLTPWAAGVRNGQKFSFDTADVLSLLGRSEGDQDAYERAVSSLLEGEDTEDLMALLLEAASDATGWCVLAAHVEQPAD